MLKYFKTQCTSRVHPECAQEAKTVERTEYREKVTCFYCKMFKNGIRTREYFKRKAAQ